jgi:hypothetical protein
VSDRWPAIFTETILMYMGGRKKGARNDNSTDKQKVRKEIEEKGIRQIYKKNQRE